MMLKKIAISLLVLSFVSVSAADVSVDVRDTSGVDLDNFDLSVSGEDTDIFREGIDDASLDLDEGQYDLDISKSDFISIERTIFVEQNEDSSYSFTLEEEEEEDDGPETEVEVSNLKAPESVCRGQSITTDVDVRNTGEDAKIVSMTASGFGKNLVGRPFVVQPDETKIYRFIFTGVEGSGQETFTVSARATGSDSITGVVEVEECEVPGDPRTVDNIDITVEPVENKDKAFVGEVVRVKGFADGVKGETALQLQVDGENISEISTNPGGFFETYFRPEKAGKITVTVSAPEAFDSEELEIKPDATVSGIRAPEKTFSGETFEVCATVNSAITPEVVLLENNDVIRTKEDVGDVCFDLTAPEPGEYDYKIRALTYAGGDDAETEVNVLGQGPEASSFPGQIETLNTEPGVLDVKLYNTNEITTNYTARLRGVPSEWIETGEKTVSLNKGERKSVFFYVSPQKEGNFSAVLEVESKGDIIYSDDVEMYSASLPPASGNKEFLDTFIRIMMFVF